ncbi:unnamed protein product [Notodromas monacha]|uniref:Spaetzle domain-containing protein n=1 Tax=Notodromas monacha TaxID=399045 RepID=A0A7R9GGU1_9CRUS|nr:unnamed protein product [Notodromas monacha]CAG0920217.1 unnamed protein product [Notodromas monacha]
MSDFLAWKRVNNDKEEREKALRDCLPADYAFVLTDHYSDRKKKEIIYESEVFRYLLERSVLQRMLLNETNDTLVLEETDRRPATTTEAVSMNDFLVSNKFKNSHMAYNTWMAHTNVTNRRIPFNPQIHNMQGKHRYKRQSDGGIDLCPTSGSFVQPKAAMNAQGNWKYVVNLGETASRFVQLVRAEICSSSECRGTCEVPLGFRATCRQQYVQKRLVSLEGDGVLSTDLFWFPHCCTCQIRRI